MAVFDGAAPGWVFAEWARPFTELLGTRGYHLMVSRAPHSDINVNFGLFLNTTLLARTTVHICMLNFRHFLATVNLQCVR